MATIKFQLGLTLLEVVVAFAVLSCALTAAYPIIGQQSFRLKDARSQRLAVLLAQSKLDEAEFIALPAYGRHDRFNWRVERGVNGTERIGESEFFVSPVTVRVSWTQGGHTRELALSSVRTFHFDNQ